MKSFGVTNKDSSLFACYFDKINKAEIETVNLTECLAVDHKKIINVVFPKIGLSNMILLLEKVIDDSPKKTSLELSKLIGIETQKVISKKS